MSKNDEALYRCKVAEGFLEEARQDWTLGRWRRSCVDNSQLAVELSAKTALALIGPVGQTHAPAALLYNALNAQKFPDALQAKIRRIAECARSLGPSVHVQSDYGDENTRRTPWELFDRTDAQKALSLAEEAVRLAKEII